MSTQPYSVEQETLHSIYPGSGDVSVSAITIYLSLISDFPVTILIGCVGK